MTVARLLALLLLLLAGPAAAEVRVLAAASLTEVLEAAGKAWTARSHVPVRFSFAASGTIARQLAAGAPADLFVSADARSMDQAMAAGAVPIGKYPSVARNRLVLVAPLASPARRVASRDIPALLGASGRLAVGDPAYVPAGRYAEQALTRAGLWPRLRSRLARAENVRAALALVSRGEAPLGIVYQTDARLDPGVRVVGRFRADSHDAIGYPMAPTVRASADGAAFAGFLLSPAGSAIFRRYGFR